MKKQGRGRKKSSGLGMPGWLPILVVASLGILAFWNSFDAPFVFDDYLSVQNNPDVRFGAGTDRLDIGGRPLLYLTFMFNYWLHDQEVWGYHLVNLILHLMNGLLIMFSARSVFRKVNVEESKARVFAMLAASFFVVHPVQTQAVTYVSSRSELLSTFFLLLAFFLFVKMPDHRVGFLLSLLVSLITYLGIQSKETVITIPIVLFIYDFFIRSHSSVRPMFSRWRFYAPFLIGGSGAAYLLLTGPLSGAVGGALPGHLSPWHYLLTQSRVITHYLRIVFLPIGLNLDHDFPPSSSPFEPAVILSSLLIFGLIGLAWFMRQRLALFSFSVFWFFVTLAPTSSIAPILDVIFEHRLYLPMAGLCLSFPFLLESGLRVLKNRTQLQVKVVPVAVVILALLTLGTVLRNEVWRDEARLWKDVVSKSPNKVRGYNALAMTYFRRDNFEKALEVSREGLENLPNSRNLFVDTIGNIYLKLGRYEEAAEAFRDAAETEAARENPDKDFVENEFNNLGVTYLYMWHFIRDNEANMTPSDFEAAKLAVLEPSLEAFEKALSLGNKEMFTALDSYVNVMSWLNRSDELILEHGALLAEEELYKSRYILGKIAFQVDDFETAIVHFEKCVVHVPERAEEPWDAPNEPLVHFNYGFALRRVGRLDDAILAYSRAIVLNPVFVEAHHNLGLLRMAKAEYDAAILNFEEVLRLYPGHVSANMQLAKIYSDIDSPIVARQYLAAVLEASPAHEEALSLWQRLGL